MQSSIPSLQGSQPLRRIAPIAKELSTLLNLRLLHNIKNPLDALLSSDRTLPLGILLHHPAEHTLQLRLLVVAPRDEPGLAGMVRRLRPLYEEEVERIAALMSDTDLEQAREEAQRGEREAQAKRREAEERLEEMVCMTRAAEARSAVKDEEIALLFRALAAATAGAHTQVLADRDGASGASLPPAPTASAAVRRLT